jgi:hypothetical protein
VARQNRGGISSGVGRFLPRYIDGTGVDISNLLTPQSDPDRIEGAIGKMEDSDAAPVGQLTGRSTDRRVSSVECRVSSVLCTGGGSRLFGRADPWQLIAQWPAFSAFHRLAVAVVPASPHWDGVACPQKKSRFFSLLAPSVPTPHSFPLRCTLRLPVLL